MHVVPGLSVAAGRCCRLPLGLIGIVAGGCKPLTSDDNIILIELSEGVGITTNASGSGDDLASTPPGGVALKVNCSGA
jgi:hypothetical protein